ncbi:hypothetical protein F5148DRAFT_1249352 [Russula earlei]|uniref:Uncharacterized protein n=1 Tax=Russula earlei TaxID=71964 RepID=A0ACC0TTT1_9AGAM|nr:hypothetical protein F5148DRAFT_1249352 [Russula earlei]
MRTSSVFAIFFLAVGITSSDGHDPRSNVQHLPSINQYPRHFRVVWSSIEEEWRQHAVALDTRFKELPDDLNQDHLLALTNHHLAMETLRTKLERLDRTHPTVEGGYWLKMMDRELESTRKLRQQIYNSLY